MYIEVNNKPLNSYSIAYFYKDEKDSKYRIVYKTTMGIIEVEEFDNSSDRDAKYDELKEIPIPGGSVNLEDKTVTPATSEQEITADYGYDGLGTVTVEAVTSSIDSSIIPQNIKKNVNILGVTGTFEDGSLNNYFLEPSNVSVPSEADAISYFQKLLKTAPNFTYPYNAYRFYYKCTSLTNAPDLDLYSTAKAERMFENCTSLTTMPRISRFYQYPYMINYSYMFNGCTSLTDASNLTFPDMNTSATVPDYRNMFNGCTALTTLPSELSIICPYNAGSPNNGGSIDITSLFNGCTSLNEQNIPKLIIDRMYALTMNYLFANTGITQITQNFPDITITNIRTNGNSAQMYSASNMFRECNHLTTVTGIPQGLLYATNLGHLFRNCTSLTTIAQLDLSTSASTEFPYFLSGCTSLVTAPEILFPQYQGGKSFALYRMFQDCTNLENVPFYDFSQVKATGGISCDNIFNNCNKLTDTSLDNILQMCISLKARGNILGTSRLCGYSSLMGDNSANVYPRSRIEALPHYQDFIAAGWTYN